MGTTSRGLRRAPSKSGLRVAFDEHVPTTLAKAFISFAKEKMIRRISKGNVWEKSADYAPRRTDADYKHRSDVGWLDRFAASGGHGIVSGDVKMRSHHHEKLALYGHGFVVIFFERKWSDWSSLRRSALMLHWWEEIATKLTIAEPGTFWIVPTEWPAKGGELRNASLGLAKLLRDRPEKVTRTKRKVKVARDRPAARRTPSNDDRQTRIRINPMD
jgi:PIN like domain